MIEFSLPFTQGEWFAWGVAVATFVYGFVGFVFPRFLLRVTGSFSAGTGDGKTYQNLMEIRASSGGMRMGLAVAAILLAQPLIYLALGLALGFSVLGRLISFVFNKAFNKKSVLVVVFEALGAFFMIGYGLMLIP